MSDMTNIVDRYIAMWNETDPARRRGLIDGLWTNAGVYVDPLMRGDGPAGIDAMVAAVQERYPGHKFRRTSDVDAHDGNVRFGWELGAPGAPPLAAGVDFGQVTDGKLASITGFLDHVAAH